MPSVSHSEVDSYLLCRRKHYYGYTLGLQRLKESSSLAMGSAGHKVLETYYRAILEGASPDNALGEAHEIAEELRQDVAIPTNRASIFDTLFDIYFPNEPLVAKGWEILAVEKEFALQYDDENELRYPFVVDIIARDPDGKVAVIDHKFVYDFYNYEASLMQPQIPKYIGALRALNHKVDYGAYNMIRTRKMKEQSFDTMVSWLDVKPEPYRVQQVFKEQIAVAAEIQNIKACTPDEQDAGAYRVANKMVCQSCSFLDICRTELVGGNGKLMMKTEYKLRERKEIAASEEVEN